MRDSELTHNPELDMEYPCEICGNYIDDCICPECPICGGVGDPNCYKKHGLIVSEEQKKSLAKRKKLDEEERKEDNKYWESLLQDISGGVQK